MATEFTADDPLLAGSARLKFTTSAGGVEDLVAKGWERLATFGPMPDGMTYTLLGRRDLTPEERRIRELEAEVARLKAGADS